MDTSDLHYFTAAADAGSFSSAGKALGRDPFTLSRRIGGLEDELGLPLFERRHGGVLLTSGGKAVLGHVRRALAEINLIKSLSHKPPHDEDGGELCEGEVVLRLLLPADEQFPVAVEPRMRALDDPAPRLDLPPTGGHSRCGREPTWRESEWGRRWRRTGHADGSGGGSLRSSRRRSLPGCGGASGRCQRSAASST